MLVTAPAEPSVEALRRLVTRLPEPLGRPVRRLARTGAVQRWRGRRRARLVLRAFEGQDPMAIMATLRRPGSLAAAAAAASAATAPTADRWQIGSAIVVEGVAQAVLERSPSDLDAIELLLECSRLHGCPKAPYREALDRLAAALPTCPEEHAEATAFLIPAHHEAGLAVLATSPDPVARACVALSGFSEDLGEPALAGLSPDQARRAELLAALACGRDARARSLLLELPPESLPLAALRRAAVRAVGAGQNARAARLLEHYLRAVPEDPWALRLRGEVNRRPAAPLGNSASRRPGQALNMTNYQLARLGFPFSSPSKPAYRADPRRVLYLLHNSLPYASSGYATRTHGLLREIGREWDVSGVTRPGFPFDTPLPDVPGAVPDRESIDGVDYRRLTTTRGSWKKNPVTGYVERYASALTPLVRAERPFALHAASNHWNGLTAVETARRFGVKSVYEVRGLWEITRGSRNPDWRDSGMFRYVARMEADAARGADRVIAITGGLRDELVARGVPEDKIAVLPNGVDSHRFRPIGKDLDLERQLGLSGKTVIGYIGSILDYEGIDHLVRAAAKLAATRADFHVLLVGDGAEREEYEALASELGVLGNHVTFTGRVPHDQVERYYSVVDIAPFPRLPLEVCELVSPLKPFEAMAMAKAVVVSSVRALDEVIHDGKTGLVHAKGDVDDLTRCLSLLMDDPSLRRRLGARAREWVARERDWAVLGRRLSVIYDELAAS
jgi:glycosyltransferase involved in cell wall biosynthesis